MKYPSADVSILFFMGFLAVLLVFRQVPQESRELLSMIIGGLFALARSKHENSEIK